MERKFDQERIEAQLKEWAAKIELLKAKADKAKAELKVKYGEEIEELQKRKEAAQLKLREIKASGGETLKELKVGVDRKFKDVKGALDRAASRFKKAA